MTALSRGTRPPTNLYRPVLRVCSHTAHGLAREFYERADRAPASVPGPALTHPTPVPPRDRLSSPPAVRTTHLLTLRKKSHLICAGSDGSQPECRCDVVPKVPFMVLQNEPWWLRELLMRATMEHSRLPISQQIQHFRAKKSPDVLVCPCPPGHWPRMPRLDQRSCYAYDRSPRGCQRGRWHL
jgi:hypothetical protein